MMLTIGIHGDTGSGKDTLADIIADLRSNHGMTFSIAFADILKNQLVKVFRLPNRDVFDKRIYKEVELDELMLANCIDVRFVDFLLDPALDSALAAPRTPRFIMQRWGDYQKALFGDDYFINAALSAINKLSVCVKTTVVTDVRYPNEAAALKKACDAKIIYLKRSINPYASSDRHSSNMRLQVELIDHVIINDGDIGGLRESAKQLLDAMF